MAARFKFDPETIRISEEEILADLSYPARRQRGSNSKGPIRPLSRRRRRRR